MTVFHRALVIAVLLMTSNAFALENLQDRLTGAKPGQTIELAAGEYRGGVTLPAGVSLKGAGVGKTIIDATGKANGVAIEGGSGSQISDLTIRNAQAAGVAARKAKSVTLTRLQVTKSSLGIQLNQIEKGLIENCISDHNSFGITVSSSADCAIVNCTVANCPEIGISLATSPNSVLFNNCIAGCGICLNIDKSSNMQADYNLYFGLFVGQMSDQISKKLLTGWQYVTAEGNKPGLDVHSVQIPVEFKNAVNGDFTPVTVLPWNLDRAVTAEWGTTQFAGIKAPQTDMAGKSRVGRVDIGAVETTVKAMRPAIGEFMVTNEEGVKSAGVFTKDGMLVSYLFQNLPLPKGEYSFWLPVRDYVGKPIPAGDYEVRLTESNFQWKYINHVGDTAGDYGWGPMTASAIPKFVTFAGKDTLVMLQGPSEDHVDLRGFDTATGKILWYVWGAAGSQGLVAKDGMVYYLRENNRGTGESRLTRVNATTGEVVPWPGAETGHMFPITGPNSYSMAVLGDRLYVANAQANKLTVLNIADGKVDKTLEVASPKSVCGDEKSKVLWVISGDKLVAIDSAGKSVAESKAIDDPACIAICDGKLAVASHKTGKVHFFDATNPAELKPTGELGKGDGPYGKIEPDRFFFQKGPAWSPKADDLCVSLALNSEGQLAVTDAERRVSMFDKDGKNLWYTYGVFGNASRPSFSTQNRRLWDPSQGTSFLMNEQTGTWQIEALWDFSAMSPQGLKEPNVQPLGDFSVGDKTFFVAISGAMGRPASAKPGDTPILTVARLEGFKAVPVLIMDEEAGKLVSRKDTNGDGKITKDDTAEPVMEQRALASGGLDPVGQPMSPARFQRFNDLQADGSILIMGKPAYIWKCTGLDAKGVPVYEGKNYFALPNKGWDKDISPYDYKPNGMAGFVQVGLLSDGGYVGQTIMRNSGGMGLNNGAGTDLCGYTPDGRLRWVNQMAAYKGIAGMGTVDDITVTTVYYSMDVLAVDGDGLGLGAFCEAPILHYTGYWIDHPNLRLFKMPDNHIYMTNGDNTTGRHNWYRLENQKSLVKTKQPFTISQPYAAELAASEFKAVPLPVTPQPKIKVAHLAQPLTIDGDLQKWRKAGVQPQIVMGPSGKIQGAGDCSALIRVAYESNNLYIQVLSFDDKPVFGNFPVWQNSVEMALNGVSPSGMQFVACKMANGKDVVWRNRFFAAFPPMFLKPEHAPCIVKVLDNAQDVSEREILEHLYGEDLSQAKVVVTEFKLPMDKVTYEKAENDVVELGPGKTFWINFFVDDSDTPYTDIQELIGWPVGSGMFSPKEEAAMAICE